MTKNDIKKEISDIKEKTKKAQFDFNRLEILNTAETGYIEYESDDCDKIVDQDVLKSHLSVVNQEKGYDIKLKRGKYTVKTDQTGRYTLISELAGNVAMYDMKTKKLFYEINVNEHINDIIFLHNELFSAVAQKKYVYVYDSQGREIHCCRKIKNIKEMQFLDYHFLLTALSYNNMLTYLDTSIGKIVAEINTQTNVSCMNKNQSNALISVGNENGTVGLFSPNQKECLMKILCHKSKVKNIEISREGEHMITCGNDNQIKIWDIRNNFEPLNTINTQKNYESIRISQMNTLALAYKNKVVFWKDYLKKNDETKLTYLHTKLDNTVINNIEFVPYEDIMSVGHTYGVSNLIVPGSGDPVFYSNEYSPFRTKKQRQRGEIQKLLQKIPYQLINQDTNIGDVVQDKNNNAVETTKQVTKKNYR
ncbi:putative U3 small nucleolar RNA-associated protein 7 [Binucleata daphniae]